MTDYIVLAIPVFLVLIGIEVLAVRLQGRDYYRLNDSLSDLSCGILDQLLAVFAKTALFAGYVWVYAHWRVADVPASSAAAWVACFLGVDFLYYWFHRMSHEVNAFWAAHVVHHQSEEYNLAVALRQGALQGWFSWVFYLPLAAIGFPPVMFLTLSSFNTLYQFWIHTRTIGGLGPLDRVLNTPSNHRVHHARNPRYIDRNHGGTLIVWDRLFGTYEPEIEAPVYGITTPLASFNPVWANLQYWVELARNVRRAHGADRARYLVKSPGWHPESLGGFVPAPEVDPASYRKFDVPLPRGLGVYVFVQFVPALLATWYALSRQAALSTAALALVALAVTATLVSLGGLLERRRWALGLEAVRLVGLAAAGLAAAEGAVDLRALAALAAGAAFLAWLSLYRGAVETSLRA